MCVCMFMLWVHKYIQVHTHVYVCVEVRGQCWTSFLVALHLRSGLMDLAMLAGQQASLGLADVAKWHIHLDRKMGLSCLCPHHLTTMPVFYTSGKDVNLGSHPCAEANSAISSTDTRPTVFS